MWTVGLTVEIKLRFRDGLARTVGLTVELKLHFRDGLVRTAFLNSSGVMWTQPQVLQLPDREK